MRYGLSTLATVLAACVLVGCTGRTQAPSDPEDPGVAAGNLVAALSAGDLSAIPANTDAQAELTRILAGMDGLVPEVTHSELVRAGNNLEVPLRYRWPFAAATWEYTSTGTMNWTGSEWRLNWTAGMIHPALTSQTRLVHTSRPATRGRLLDRNLAALTDEGVVLRIGIDKPAVDPAQVEDSARRLARALGINEENYVGRVQAYGPQAFVEALSLRHDADQPEGWREIPGARGLTARRNLAVDRDFAPEIIGLVGPATVELAADAGPTVLVDDPVGVSGLQRRHDALLRGEFGATVTLAPEPREVLFEAPPQAGQDLVTTFDSDLQQRAETVLDGVSGSAALVAVRPSDGTILAAAVSPGSGPDPDATFGHFPPGSTFKVVTSLALLRAGLTPESLVDCSETITVDGRTIKNYDGYPRQRLGRIPLSDALAYSCNTAFIAERDRISSEALQDAAESLGLGRDYEAGFSSFFGAVPKTVGDVAKSESLIGQGTVEASPMAMAGVAASVATGRTVIPRLVTGFNPPQPVIPLTAAEAQALQGMMAATVTEGTATELGGSLVQAKTGTAEFGPAQEGPEGSPRTHAWLIGATASDLAIAVWVHDGRSGAATALPIARAFLT